MFKFYITNYGLIEKEKRKKKEREKRKCMEWKEWKEWKQKTKLPEIKKPI